MHPQRVAALVAVALAATLLTGCSLTSVRDEPVALDGVRDAYVLTSSGERPAANGATLGKGDTVRTGPGGSATLVVRDRRVVLGGDTTVTVPDGASVALSRGALLVDRRRGPGLTVEAGDTIVDNVGSGALRVEKSFAVLVAALSAGARVRTSTGPRLGLDPLHQVVVPGRSLPRAALPLQLRGDDWDRLAIPGVVEDDEALNDLARDLDGPSSIVPASYRPRAGLRRSDEVLADAIGYASGRNVVTRRSAANRALLLRADGGSWGVVARLLDTDAGDVEDVLDDVLRGGPIATATPTVAPPDGPDTPVVAQPSPRPGVQPSPTPRPTRTPGPEPTETGEPTESPSPSPDVVDQLISAIPSPLVPLGTG